jgi:dihydrofolate reductase
MTTLIDISMSLDGFVTAPNDGPEGRGLGDGGEVLHYWVFGGPWTYDGERGTATGVDKDVLEEAMGAEGATVAGRRMYDTTNGWGGKSPFGPCVVVTHRVDDQPAPESGFEFVDGVEAAVGRAREIAGDDGVVGIGGGASIIQQALRAGLVDELHLHVAPVLLGAGRTLFGELGVRLDLERIRVRESPYATHVDLRIRKDRD